MPMAAGYADARTPAAASGDATITVAIERAHACGNFGPGATPPRRSVLGPHGIGNSGASAGTGGHDGFESFAGQRRSTPTTSAGEAVRIRVRVPPPNGCRGPLPLPTRQVVTEDRPRLAAELVVVAATSEPRLSSLAVPPTCP